MYDKENLSWSLNTLFRSFIYQDNGLLHLIIWPCLVSFSM